MKIGIVTVLVGEEELTKMNEAEVKWKMSILKCPKFWKMQTDAANSRSNLFERDLQYEQEWGLFV